MSPCLEDGRSLVFDFAEISYADEIAIEHACEDLAVFCCVAKKLERVDRLVHIIAIERLLKCELQRLDEAL